MPFRRDPNTRYRAKQLPYTPSKIRIAYGEDIYEFKAGTYIVDLHENSSSHWITYVSKSGMKFVCAWDNTTACFGWHQVQEFFKIGKFRVYDEFDDEDD